MTTITEVPGVAAAAPAPAGRRYGLRVPPAAPLLFLAPRSSGRPWS
ncbi:hypothetical protein [Streptosporangium sp. NPDC048865]